MSIVRFDPGFDDDERRGRLYAGELLVFPPLESAMALCGLAREMLEEAFAPLDPREAQYHMPVERYVDIVAPLKPRFIHHPEAKRHIQGILQALGCDPWETHLDVPRLRMVTSDGYLTAGVGYAHHPHRDTWYSAPMCQLNWWLPIYEFDPDSALAFHPRYWDRAVPNSSGEFNYYEWNRVGRRQAARQIGTDTRKQPAALDPLEPAPDLRVVCRTGGIILFSGAHLHSAVPNTSGRTRYSIDFRTVHAGDLRAGRGAPNLDSAPTGTSLRDFLRAADLEAMPADLVAMYDSGSPPAEEDLVYRPADIVS
jgi:hypothetical protein